MLEPTLYIFQDGKLCKQGQARIEFQTPEEYLRSTPLIEDERVDWGNHVIRFLRMPTPGSSRYVLVEKYENGKPDPTWALIQVDEKDLPKFRDQFQVYCEK